MGAKLTLRGQLWAYERLLKPNTDFHVLPWRVHFLELYLQLIVVGKEMTPEFQVQKESMLIIGLIKSNGALL